MFRTRRPVAAALLASLEAETLEIRTLPPAVQAQWRTIRPGMRRDQMDRIARMDGGLQAREGSRYFLPLQRPDHQVMMFEVTWQTRGAVRPDDRLATVGAPYLSLEHAD